MGARANWTQSAWAISSRRTRAARSTPSGTRKKFGLVEDNTTLLNLYPVFLKIRDDAVLVASSSGEEIIEASKFGQLKDIDVVIMDYIMKNMDGFQAAREILEFNPRIMIIIASADETIRSEALAVGFKFLLKPFRLSDLITIIRD